MRRLIFDRHVIIPILPLLAAFVLVPVATFAQPATPPAPPTPWWQRVSFFGDMRVRQDNLYQDGSASRHQARIRLRFGVRAPINDDVSFTIRFSTGDLKSHNSNVLRRDETGQVVGFESGFRLVDVIGQATLDTGRPAYPLSVTVEWVVNTRGPSGQNTGVWLEAYYGRMATPRTYRLGYRFMRIEREAVVTAYNHSELPGSNMFGNALSFAYQPLPKFTLEVIGLFSRAIDGPAGAPNPTLARLQIDAKATF